MPDLKALLDELIALDYSPLIFALLIGGAIGLQREVHGRPAGLRTHILVCVSAALLTAGARTLTVQDVPNELLRNLVYDPNRIGAGIVTGIGFLGAATVIRSGDFVRGITTAACVWFVAGAGVVVGQGHYALATAATAVVFAVLVFLDPFTSRLPTLLYRRLIVLASGDEVDALANEIVAVLKKGRVRLLESSGSYDRDADRVRLVMDVRLRSSRAAPSFLERIAKLDRVRRVQWSSAHD